MKEALKLALEALEGYESCIDGYYAGAVCPQIDKAIVAIKEALAQPEQEPDKYVMDIECTKCGAKQSGVLTVNTTPPQRKCENCGEFGTCCLKTESQEQNRRAWVGLSLQEQAKIMASIPDIPFDGEWHALLLNTIEAKLKEKNT